MTAKFEIEKTFSIPIKSYFVIAGNLIEGHIEPHSNIVLGNKEINIAGVEFLDRIKPLNESMLSLIIEYRTDEELKTLSSIFKIGETITITN